MNRTPTHYTIAAYYGELKRKNITVNAAYQRSDEVWPAAARSFLVETVIKNFPIPTIYLHQKTDLRTKITSAEIVDGQQRSVALRDFLDNEFALATVIEDEDLHGKRFSELDDELKQHILEYQLDVDLFTAASSEDVVEVFRRMNSYTVPLNPEEKRHAQNQGKFKWFVNRTADGLTVLFQQLGIFSKQQLVRMQDNKLITDLCDSFINGIRTTKAKELDAIYKNNDETFPQESEYAERIHNAFDFIRHLEGVAETRITKPYMVYSLAQAITHYQQQLNTFAGVYTFDSPIRDVQAISRNLLTLNAAFKNRHSKRFQTFVDAAKSKTNVKENRETRFSWYCRALVEDFTE